MTTPRVPGNRRPSGRPALPVAILPPRARNRSGTSLKNAWPAPRRVPAASPLPKPCACTPSNSTVPRSAAGRWKTIWLMPSRQKKIWHPCAAGNARKSANSGSSTPRPISGSRIPKSPSPCSTGWRIAAAPSPIEKPPATKVILGLPSPAATTPSGPRRPLPSKNPRAASPIPPNNLSCFANHKISCFENYAAAAVFTIDICGRLARFAALLRKK